MSEEEELVKEIEALPDMAAFRLTNGARLVIVNALRRVVDAEVEREVSADDVALSRWLQKGALPQYAIMVRSGESASLYEEREIYIRYGSWKEMIAAIRARDSHEQPDI